jgi:hypothetical protein
VSPTESPASSPIVRRWVDYHNASPEFSVSLPAQWVVVTRDIAITPAGVQTLISQRPPHAKLIRTFAQEIRDDDTRILLAVDPAPDAASGELVITIDRDVLGETGGFEPYLKQLVADIRNMNEPFELQRVTRPFGNAAVLRTSSPEYSNAAYLFPVGDVLFSLSFGHERPLSAEWDVMADTFLPYSTRR